MGFLKICSGCWGPRGLLRQGPFDVADPGAGRASLAGGPAWVAQVCAASHFRPERRIGGDVHTHASARMDMQARP